MSTETSIDTPSQAGTATLRFLESIESKHSAEYHTVHAIRLDLPNLIFHTFPNLDFLNRLPLTISIPSDRQEDEKPAETTQQPQHV